MSYIIKANYVKRKSDECKNNLRTIDKELLEKPTKWSSRLKQTVLEITN